LQKVASKKKRGDCPYFGLRNGKWFSVVEEAGGKGGKKKPTSWLIGAKGKKAIGPRQRKGRKGRREFPNVIWREEAIQPSVYIHQYQEKREHYVSSMKETKSHPLFLPGNVQKGGERAFT